MRFRALVTATAVALIPLACSGGEPAEETLPPTQSEAPQETQAPEAATGQPETAATVNTAPMSVQPIAVRVDEPYDPVYSGTVAPGMTRDDVVQVWGEPATERAMATRLYMYYRNGCEASCGTFDVVFLDNGTVVDAIVRGPGHEYSGASSSPAGSEGVFTPPAPGM